MSFESDTTCVSDKISPVFVSYKKIEIMKQKAVTHSGRQEIQYQETVLLTDKFCHHVYLVTQNYIP